MVITGLTRNQLESNLSGVRIPPSPPQRQNCYLIISNLPQILPLHTLVLTIRILSMRLSTVSGETLEWWEMVINEMWTSVTLKIYDYISRVFIHCKLLHYCCFPIPHAPSISRAVLPFDSLFHA